MQILGILIVLFSFGLFFYVSLRVVSFAVKEFASFIKYAFPLLGDKLQRVRASTRREKRPHAVREKGNVFSSVISFLFVNIPVSSAKLFAFVVGKLYTFARPFAFVLSKFFFFLPLIFYTHNVAPVSTLWLGKVKFVYLLLLIPLLIYRGIQDYREAPHGAVSQFLYYVIGAYTLILWYPIFYMIYFQQPMVFPGLVIFAACLYFGLKRIDKLSFSNIFVSLFMTMLACFVIAMLSFTSNDHCHDQPDNPALEFYLNFCDQSLSTIPQNTLNDALSDEQLRTITAYHRLFAPVGDKFLLSASKDFSFIFDPANNKVTPIEPYGGFFSAVYDKKTGRIFAACTVDSILRVYNFARMQVVESFNYKKKALPYWLELDEELGRLFVGYGAIKDAPRVIIYDTNTLLPIAEDILAEPNGTLAKATLSAKRHSAYFIVMFNLGRLNYISSYNLAELKQGNMRATPWFSTAIAYSSEFDSVFLSTPLANYKSGEIIECDPVTLKTRSNMFVPIGARHLAVASDGLVYSANYLNGILYKIDWQRKVIVDSIYIGRKAKRMEYYPRENAIFFTSERGYARVNLDEWK